LPDATQTVAPPHLIRALGRRDLVLLFVVAVFNLNVVPSIAANGGVTVWLWIISLLLFFWPQGIAVIELAHRYPGEGGVYLWAKEVFGDFHGFLSGWCYWTNNFFYVPTVLLYFVGVSVFVAGPRHQNLAENRLFTISVFVLLTALLVILNIRGLGVGKWINNVGGIGTFVAAAVLIGLGLVVFLRHGTTLTASDFRIPPDPRSVLNAFGTICFGLVGLELASVMGDEVKDPRRTLPGAVAWGGVISGSLYVGATLVVLASVGKKDISALQGVVQAVAHLSGELSISWLMPIFAVVLAVSIAGIASAWIGGVARIPFVAGLDSYLPSWLGRLHPRYATPYAALLTHATISILLTVLFAAFADRVKEVFQVLLGAAVVLQLVPFLYVFAALVKLSSRTSFQKGFYSRTFLLVTGSIGLLTTILGIVLELVFRPEGFGSLVRWDIEVFGATMLFVGLAFFFFYVYGRRKVLQPIRLAVGEAPVPAERGSAH
jgi:glutamate:GABA antiporter